MPPVCSSACFSCRRQSPGLSPWEGSGALGQGAIHPCPSASPQLQPRARAQRPTALPCPALREAAAAGAPGQSRAGRQRDLHAPEGLACRQVPSACLASLIPGRHQRRTNPDSRPGQTGGPGLGKTQTCGAADQPGDPLRALGTTDLPLQGQRGCRRALSCTQLGRGMPAADAGCRELSGAGRQVNAVFVPAPARLLARALGGCPLTPVGRPHLSSVEPRFSISFVTSAISSFSRCRRCTWKGSGGGCSGRGVHHLAPSLQQLRGQEPRAPGQGAVTCLEPATSRAGARAQASPSRGAAWPQLCWETAGQAGWRGRRPEPASRQGWGCPALPAPPRAEPSKHLLCPPGRPWGGSCAALLPQEEAEKLTQLPSNPFSSRRAYGGN